MAEKKKDPKIIHVSDWMSEGVLAVETFDSIGIARKLMAKHRVNQLPVLDNDVLVGIVTDRDIRDAYPTSMMINRGEAIDRFAETVTVEEVMTHDLITVHPETPLVTAVMLLRRQRIGSLPVTKNKKVVGIITRSDVLDFVLSGAGGKLPKKHAAVKARLKKKVMVKPAAARRKRTRVEPK